MIKSTVHNQPKAREDEVVITIDLTAVGTFFTIIFAFLGKILAQIGRWLLGTFAIKLSMTIGVALVIGFGLAVTVLQNPSSVEAQPGLAQTKPALWPRTITWQNDEYPIKMSDQSVAMQSLLPTDDLVVVDSFGSINDVNPVILLVGRGHALSSAVSEANLGDTVEILADNAGIYTYTLLRTQTVLRRDLTSAFQEHGYAVAIAVPVDRLQTQYQLYWWQ